MSGSESQGIPSQGNTSRRFPTNQEIWTSSIQKRCDELLKRGHGGYNIMMRAFEMAEKEVGDDVKLEELKEDWMLKVHEAERADAAANAAHCKAGEAKQKYDEFFESLKKRKLV